MTLRLQSRRALSLALLIAAGCDHRDHRAKIAQPAETRFIRLVDRLSSATIESPLKQVPAVASVQGLGGKVTRVAVLREDFEHVVPGSLAWPAGDPNAGLVAYSRNGVVDHALHLGGDGSPRPLSLILPAQPNTYYLVGRSSKTSDSSYADLRVIERRSSSANTAASKSERLLFIHYFPTHPEDPHWHRDSVVFRSAAETHSLVVTIEPTNNRPSKQEAWFDDLTVEKITLTPEQELSLLKAAQLAAGADPELGIAKHGQLLPLADLRTVAAPYDDNFDSRYALFAPAHTTITFPVRTPSDATLDFSYALARDCSTESQVTFRISVEADGLPPSELFSRTLAAEASAWSWHQQRIDLTAYAGKRVRLSLETSSPGPRAYGLWGNPVIDTPREKDGPPNVVLIGLDTLRADRLSVFGYSRDTSPHLNALAADGVAFSQAISTTNWTTPAFASIFTGVVPSRHQLVLDNSPITQLSPNLESLASRFRVAGWTTGAIMSKDTLYDRGLDQGFDSFFNVPVPLPSTEATLSKALSWLDKNQNRRFFLFLHLDTTHQPFNMPERFQHAFTKTDLTSFGTQLPLKVTARRAFAIDPKSPGEWPTLNDQLCEGCSDGQGLSPAFKSLARDLYDGAVAYMDDGVGRFIAGLKERGLYQNTIIVVVSDHGELNWEHEDYYGHQKYLYDELIRVPLIIKPVGHSGAGKAIATQVRNLDIMPTLLELAGLVVPDSKWMEAKSLVPLMEGQRLPDRAAFSEFERSISVRREGWKYIYDQERASQGAMTERLFHVAEDPGETIDLSGREPARLRAARAAAADYFLRQRTGYYIVLAGGHGRRHFAVRLQADVPFSVEPYLGPSPSYDRSRLAATAQGESDEPLLLLGYLRALPENGITLSLDGGPTQTVRTEQFHPYEAGMLDKLLLADQPGLSLLAGPPPVDNDRHEMGTVNAQQLEALKATDYIK